MKQFFKIDWDRPLTTQENEFKKIMLKSMPDIVPRSQIEKLTWGWLNLHTLKKDESLGTGPREQFKTRSGRKVFYQAEELVEYGIRRYGIFKIKND